MKKALLGISLSLALSWALDVQEIGGLQSPESVYVKDNVMFASNLGKEIKPLEKDQDGFILKMDLNGKVLGKISKLDAPKGMSIIGDTLYVTDIDTVKGFSLKDNAQVFSLPISGAIFLNDIVDAGNSLYVSDTGSGKIYKINPKKNSYEEFITLDHATYGGGPNGLLIQGDQLYSVTYDPAEKLEGKVLAISLKTKDIKVLPEAQGFLLDGIARDDKGNLLVSAWGYDLKGEIYKIAPDQQVSTLSLRPIQGCADIFYSKGTLYIPAMVENKLLKVKLQ